VLDFCLKTWIWWICLDSLIRRTAQVRYSQGLISMVTSCMAKEVWKTNTCNTLMGHILASLIAHNSLISLKDLDLIQISCILISLQVTWDSIRTIQTTILMAMVYRGLWARATWCITPANRYTRGLQRLSAKKCNRCQLPLRTLFHSTLKTLKIWNYSIVR